MKVELSKILASVSALKELSKLKLPALVAYDLACFLADIETHVNQFAKVRSEKIKQYGTEKKNGDWEVSPANMIKFQEEIVTLSKKEIELSDFSLLKTDLSDEKIEAMHLVALRWLIK